MVRIHLLRGEECARCGTTRYKIKARKLCTRCYYIILKIEKAEKWDYKDLSSLVDFPYPYNLINEDDFNKIKTRFIEEYKERLEVLRGKEEFIKGNSTVDGITIEFQLQRIAKEAGVKKKVFHGIAGTIDFNFNPEQRRILFRLLNNIEENIPKRGFNINNIILEL